MPSGSLKEPLETGALSRIFIWENFSQESRRDVRAGRRSATGNRVYHSKSGTEGSNPSLSAKFYAAKFGEISPFCLQDGGSAIQITKWSTGLRSIGVLTELQGSMTP